MDKDRSIFGENELVEGLLKAGAGIELSGRFGGLMWFDTLTNRSNHNDHRRKGQDEGEVRETRIGKNDYICSRF